MDEYKPNSHVSREKQEMSAPEKRVDKVVTGQVRSRRKGLSGIFSSNEVSGVKSYILMDVLIPSLKKAVSDIVRNGTDMLRNSVDTILYPGGSPDRQRTSSAAKVSYARYYDRRDEGRATSARSMTGYSYDDLVFENRGDAEEVLLRMDELIEMFGLVSVADLYDLAGRSGSYTDNKYGWTDISSACAVRVQDGYVLKLPRAMPL